ncbi:MAG TPA: hypothetical protein VGN18_06080 [Jatrophihabitans sp.]|uniref:hypothetical protein n=1 Tax=Jatrophihabitans sp. TaxID=1932789 RepID=UPI002DF83F90|nr:hypothetical protein [Jatrophihabitans sp.]
MSDAAPEHGRHEAPEVEEPPRSFRDEVRDAVSARTTVLILGVLLIQLGFVLSYVGAFHSPKPHRIPVAVVAPAQQSGALVGRINGIAGAPLRAVAVGDAATARRQVVAGDTSAALVIDPGGTKDTVLVASGGGTSVVTAVQQVLTAVEAAQHRTVELQDIVPLQSGDGRGLTGFYLVIGWIVGGYLVAALLGAAKGARPANRRRAVIRLLALVPYALLSGLGGALVVGPGLSALCGHFVALWALGTLVVFGAAAVTMAFQVIFGVLGIGLTVVVFVVLGNPSAGGAYQPALLPPFWRALSGALPNGAATDTVRRIAYFGAGGVGGHLVVLAVYALAGVAVTLVASGRRRARPY